MTTTSGASAPPFVPPTLEPVRAPSAEERDHQRVVLTRAEVERARDAGRAAAAAEIAALRAEHEHEVAELRAASSALRAAAAHLHALDRATLEDLQDHAVELALELAAAVIGRELTSMDDPLIQSVKRAAGLLPDRGDVVVRLAPTDVARATGPDGAPDQGLVEALGGSHEVVIVPDPTIESGAVVVDVGRLRVDAQLGPALDRLQRALRA